MLILRIRLRLTSTNYLAIAFIITMMAGMYLIDDGSCLSRALLTYAASSFADQPLPDDQVTPHLSALIQTYLSTMSSIGAETWIMHGTLLSWWWNQKVSSSCPWLSPNKSDSGPDLPQNQNYDPYNAIGLLTCGSLDLPMGQRPRRTNLRADDPLPGRILQHDGASFRFTRCQRGPQICTRDQSQLRCAQ
jgi:hypothetical protein